MDNNTTYSLIKADVLAGMSGYAACHNHGEDPLKWAKRLSMDPDIVAAKASGSIKDRATKRMPPSYFRALPFVVDVLDNGMTQSAAARKHGVSQPHVNASVKRAREATEMFTDAPAAATPSGPIAAVSASVAQAVASGHSKEEVLKAVLGAL
jgi:predicted DNA-binding protein (UPF0251 family)